CLLLRFSLCRRVSSSALGPRPALHSFPTRRSSDLELRERWSRRRPAAPALGLRVDLEGLVQGDLEDLILRREGTGVRALSQVWPVPAVLGGDLYFFRVLALPLGDGADDPGQ